MSMSSKTSNFLKAIDKYAKEQQREIKAKANEFKIKELQRAEAEVLRDSYHLIQREMASMRKKIDGEVSKVEIEKKRALLSKRYEITENIFNEAKMKLIEFSKSKEYLNVLLKSVRKISEVFNDTDDTIFYVKKEDLAYEDDIKKEFPLTCKVKKNKKIQIGGVLANSTKLGINIDETLDSKLENQREWFAENSNLSIV